MTTLDTPATRLPRPYLAWLSGVTVGRLGDAVLTFALGWAATGHGGSTAALVLTLNGLPRLVLLVVGGAIADRFGARRIMIAGEALLLGLSAALAAAITRVGTPVWLLAAASVALGTVTAFCLPATGSMPRRLVPDALLTRALALRQGSGQVVLLVAAPLGGLLVGSVGVPAIAWADAVALGVSLGVLVTVRELEDPAADPVLTGRRRALDLAGGVRAVRATPGLGSALLLTGAGAALMLPVPALLVPLLGRASGWGSGTTGAVAGAIGLGVVAAAVMASRSRHTTSRTTARPGVTGLATSGAGAGVLAACQLVGAGNAATVVALAGALLLGFGSGSFVAELAPLVLGSAPRTHLARVQALVGLVQLVPVLVTNLALGALAEHASPGWALGATGAALAVCSVWARGRPAVQTERSA